MSSRSVAVIGPNTTPGGPPEATVGVEGATQALLVKVVNPSGGGGPSANVNLAEYGGAAVGAGNAVHVQPGTGAVFAVAQSGAWTVAATQGTSPWVVSGTVSVGNFPAVQPVNDNGGSLTVDGTVTATQGTSPWVVGQTTHANLNAQVRLQDRDGAALLSVLNIGDAPAILANETGSIPLALVTDDPKAVGGTMVPLRMNEQGFLYVVNGGGNIGVTQITSPWVVSGTVAATQSGAWTVAATQSGAWTVAATQSGTWNIGTVTPGTAATNLGKAEDAVHASGDVGVMALAVRSDTPAATAAAGDYTPLLTASDGRLHARARIQGGVTGYDLDVYQTKDAIADLTFQGILPLFHVSDDPPFAGTISEGTWNQPYMTTGGAIHAYVGNQVSVVCGQVTPGSGAAQLGKLEDNAHATGDLGVMALAVRRDTLASTTSANNDYATLNVDSVGALWTRIAGVTTIALSGSTRGRPIQITGTNSAGAVTLHTATTTSGQLDRLYIDLTNTSDNSVVVTIEFGTTGTANELHVTVPARETVPAVVGMVIGGAATDTIKAYAATANVINAVGRVERLS
jgi:hypothetical protein